MASFINQIFGKEIQLENLSESYPPQSLRIDSKGHFHLIDTTSRSTWKGRLISLIQWFVYGNKTKACDLAIGKAIDQFEETLLKTAETAENLIKNIDTACKTIVTFKEDPDFSHRSYLKQKIEGFRIQILKLLSNKENAHAHNELGFCYLNGLGVDKDEEEAFKLYVRANNRGDAFGRYNLGYCYQNGIGGFKNEIRAVKLYKSAAKEGHTQAQNKLAYCYEYGIGTQENKEKAVEFYTLAAQQGNQEAKEALERLRKAA